MDYNYMALLVWIFRNCTPEEAFKLLDGKKYKRLRVDPRDTLEMIEMKKNGCTYKEIGLRFGIAHDTAYKRIKKELGCSSAKQLLSALA